MNKKMPISLAVAIIFVAMTVTFSLTMILSQRIFDSNVSSVQEKYATFEKLSKLDIVARNNFNGDINDDTLMDTIAAGYIAGLGDKSSKYYTSAQYTDLQKKQEGKLMGIGVDVMMDTTSGYAKVIKLYADSPATDAGIVLGDYITKIGETDVRTLTAEKVKNLLYGEEGEQVNITYVNYINGEEKIMDIVHRTFSLPTVETELVGTNGYVKISNFTSNTPVEFDTKVQSLISNGAKTLVFDVRNTTSTDYDSVHRILDILMPSGTLMQAQYKDGTVKVLYTSDAREIDMPMIVIANEGTYGGGEMFAALLRESGKAKVVGTETQGHGTLQQFFVQSDGSAIEITVANLLTAKGTSFDGVGITPDYEVTLSDDQKQGFYTLTTADDPQILRAFEVASGITTSANNKVESSGTTDDKKD